MTRQTLAVAVLAATASCFAAGITAGVVDARQDQIWQQRLNDAVIQLESAQTAPTSWQVTGQDPHQHYRQCLTAVAAYNTAAAHLHDQQLDPSTECQP